LSTEIRLHREYRLVGRVGEGGAVQSERFYRALRLAVDREFAQDLAEEARELDTVTCTIEDENLELFLWSCSGSGPSTNSRSGGMS